MIFRTKHPSTQQTSTLKPFALQTKESHLIGFVNDEHTASPCVHCIELWLSERGVWSARADISEITSLRKDRMAELLLEKSSHVFYEIFPNGTANKLECLVFPHPQCQCPKKNYLPPSTFTKHTNFAFSPIEQLKCVRYGTPAGNLWHFTAFGHAPKSATPITVTATDPDREKARLLAVQSWMASAAHSDLEIRISSGKKFLAKDICNDQISFCRPTLPQSSVFPGLGKGNSQEEALLDALYERAKYQTLKQYSALSKRPMLIVGNNSWLRNKVPFFLLQQYDLYLLFYPNPSPAWVVGIAAFSRLTTTEKPKFHFGASSNPLDAMDEAVYGILGQCRPMDWKTRYDGIPQNPKETSKTSKLNLWWTNWIYRCPKISMKDILQLEPYESSVERWKVHLQENHHQVSSVPLNSSVLPSEITSVIKLEEPQEAQSSQTLSNLNGIGSWNTFQELYQ